MLRRLPILSPESSSFTIRHLYGVDDPSFERAIGSLLGPSIQRGNRVETLLNGDQIFASMLEAIGSAQQSITFETYVFWDGVVAKKFAETLSERARAGVRVHAIIDWYGANRLQQDNIRRMEEAGVEVRLFHPLAWYNPLRWSRATEMDHRTHRKLLVVDGKVGFIGGVGIADEWAGNAQSPEEWRDTHFRVEGPVVAQLQSAFLDNWLELGGSLLHGERYFPALEAKGSVAAQAFKSSSHEATESVEIMYRVALAAAAKSIEMENAYFVPDAGMQQALIQAARRGVKIEIIVPGTHIDETIVRSASRTTWTPLLEAGIRIYEFQPTMLHCKSLVIDGFFTSVGSTNFDTRSFHLNDEANLNIFDRDFAAVQQRIFNEDKLRSKEITLEAWKARPYLQRAEDFVSGLFRDEL